VSSLAQALERGVKPMLVNKIDRFVSEARVSHKNHVQAVGSFLACR
jgi:hypothetical protein